MSAWRDAVAYLRAAEMRFAVGADGLAAVRKTADELERRSLLQSVAIRAARAYRNAPDHAPTRIHLDLALAALTDEP